VRPPAWLLNVVLALLILAVFVANVALAVAVVLAIR
jgi:hypothetical protein